MTNSILEGIRIIDLASGLAGPMATRLLAEAGADVIKIEHPEGDPIREHHPAAFSNWNRSKRSIVLDLNTQQGRDHLLGLLAEADILVHGFSPARAAALGLDDQTLSQHNQHLIVSAVTGYMRTHPDAEKPGYEVLVQAQTAMMDEQMGHDDGPTHLRLPLASWTAAYLAASGILARLILRQRTGKAGPAHTSLQQGAYAAMGCFWNREEHPTEFLIAKIPLPKRMAFPAITLFRCADGRWIQTLGGFMENPLVIETIAMMGEEYVFVPFQQMPTPEQKDLWQRMFEQRDSGEWLQAFWDGDVPAGMVYSIGEVLKDPQVIANGHVTEVDDPVWGKVRQSTNPFHLSPAGMVQSAAPTLGQHQGESWSARNELSVSPSGPYPRRPLEGLKVLDFGMFLAGPFAPSLMADMGADVIKVEATTGDRMRISELMFIGCQRGKRSLAIDLTKDESRDVIERLVKWADVVHHNLRRPAAESLGIDEPTLRKIKPDLIYCHVSSYGSEGPRADWPGYDPIAQAYSGHMDAGAGKGNPPMWIRSAPLDFQTALSSLVGTLLAVYQRDRTGNGNMVTASLMGIAATLNSETMILPDGSFAPTPELDHDQKLVGEGYGVYRTGDGWVAVAAVGKTKVGRLREAVGATSETTLAAAFAALSVDKALALLGESGIPAESVRVDYQDEFFDDPDNQRVKLATHTEHKVYGRVDNAGAFWVFDDLDLTLDRPVPLLGEHSSEILADLGFEDAAMSAMTDNGTVVVTDVAFIPR
ncbi:CoA transferase [Gordonia insulae]|uniref:CoA-transferase/lyase DddD n=1 Tax=Gordonia insulae TaxID=2420509 RepID=A0A3G8JMQ9_9ACTN|nr:CoA transferase [Gordonia insulae]AZG45470.1 CoA-transferase/lyase DddD [Gordonia insulae]